MTPLIHRCFIERPSRWWWRAECSCDWKGRKRWHPLLAEREADTHRASTQPPSPQAEAERICDEVEPIVADVERKTAAAHRLPAPTKATGSTERSPQAEAQDCERCEGKGVVYEPGTLQTHPPIVGSNVPCPDRKGTGKQPPAEPQEAPKVWVYEDKTGAFAHGPLRLSLNEVVGTSGRWYVPEADFEHVAAEAIALSEKLESAPAEPQGDAVEVLARTQFDLDGHDGAWLGVSEPMRAAYREDARKVLAAITPLLYEQWRSSYAEKLEKLAGGFKARQHVSAGAGDADGEEYFKGKADGVRAAIKGLEK